MTPDQKALVRDMFSGHWLRKSRNHNRKDVYKVYDEKGNLYAHVFPRTVNGIDKDPEHSVFKGDAKVKMTLNLSNIRKLHGRSWIKQTYKYYQKKLKNNS